MNKKYDVVIVGAGPAGLSAALSAAESGQNIVILDNNPQPGGQIWRAGPVFPIPPLAKEKYDKLEKFKNIDFIYSAKIVASFNQNQLIVELSDHALTLTYTNLILCTGARELFLPFPGWTLEGVTGAGGLQALIKAGTPIKNERIVIAGSGPLLLASAQTARKAQAHVVYIAEQAPKSKTYKFALQLWQWPQKIFQALSMPFHLYQPNSYIIEAIGTNKLEAVRLQTPSGVVTIECDRLACGFGLVPNIQLAQMLKCHIEENQIKTNQYQLTSQSNIYAAGECTGFGGSELSIIEGTLAGYAATNDLERANELLTQKQHYQKFADLLKHSFNLRPEIKQLARPDTIFCRCEDVSFEKISNRKNWIDAKIHTRCGMGACQGSTCAATAACLFDWEIKNARPPVFPARLKTLTTMYSSTLKSK